MGAACLRSSDAMTANQADRLFHISPVRWLLPWPPPTVPQILWARVRWIRWVLFPGSLLLVSIALLMPELATFVCLLVPLLLLVCYRLISREKNDFLSSLESLNFQCCPQCGYCLRGLPQECTCPECGISCDLDSIRTLWLSFKR